MRVKAIFLGPLKQDAGEGRYEVNLPEGSTLKVFIVRLGEELGEEFSKRLMPDESSRFPLLILVGGNDHRFCGGMRASLRDGVTVYFAMPVGGGWASSNLGVRWSARVFRRYGGIALRHRQIKVYSCTAQ